jgi:hypothetical protein
MFTLIGSVGGIVGGAVYAHHKGSDIGGYIGWIFLFSLAGSVVGVIIDETTGV